MTSRAITDLIEALASRRERFSPDRAETSFRVFAQDYFDNCTLQGIREYAAEADVLDIPNNRQDASIAIADALIAR